MAQTNDSQHEGRDEMFMDIDRMVNEGLGGGYTNSVEDDVDNNNARIEDSTTDTMDHPESVTE